MRTVRVVRDVSAQYAMPHTDFLYLDLAFCEVPRAGEILDLRAYGGPASLFVLNVVHLPYTSGLGIIDPPGISVLMRCEGPEAAEAALAAGWVTPKGHVATS